MKKKNNIDVLDLIRKAKEAIEDKKGEDISVFDLRKQSSITDYCIVASGFSPPHLKAMYSETQHVLKKAGIQCFSKSGNPEGGWMVLDYVDLIIHIFLDESRKYYAIEELWAKAPRLN
jgi:ribosome-associated protein